MSPIIACKQRTVCDFALVVVFVRMCYGVRSRLQASRQRCYMFVTKHLGAIAWVFSMLILLLDSWLHI